MGATESTVTGMQLDHRDNAEWHYFYIDPVARGLEWHEQAPGVYECVHIRTPGTEKYHPVWLTFPDLKEWHTKDPFTEHPSIPNHWMFESRFDDLIIFSGGAKHNPMVYEEQMRTNPLIATAIVAGTGPQQPALLIELRNPVPDTVEDLDTIMEKVLPKISEANADAPKHTIIKKTHVLIAAQDKPLYGLARERYSEH